MSKRHERSPGYVRASERECGYPGCSSEITEKGARGYCPPHYRVVFRRVSSRPERVDNRYWLYRLTTIGWDVNETGCWIWCGELDSHGYGVIPSEKAGYSRTLAHRVSQEAFNGPLVEGSDVCHLCDTPSCVNPDHLFLASREDNMRDAAFKGRLFRPCKATGITLGLEERREVFQRFQTETASKIARDFNVTTEHINTVVQWCRRNKERVVV